MEYVCANDQFKVELASILTDFDRKVLSELYQPIIGYASLSLFFTLWSKHERKLCLDFVNHSMIFNSMHINQKDFTAAKRKLEGLGLLRTFVEEADDYKKYIYVLYAPKNPKDFFDDVLFSGMLTKVIGEEEAKTLAMSFVSTQKKDEKFQEITASFVDEFNPDFDDKCFVNNRLNELDSFGRKVRTIDTDFDFNAFFTQLKTDYKLNRKMFGKLELVEIERLSTLYGIDELDMSSLVYDSFDTTKDFNKRLDCESLENLCKKEVNFIVKEQSNVSTNIINEDLDVEIQLMEKLSSKDYLVYLQKGAKASPADLAIVSMLSKEYGLAPNVINCIFFYSLKKCNNKLPKGYIEKIAASVVRSDLDNAADVYQYLFESQSNVDINEDIVVKETTNKEVSQPKDENEEIDLSLARRLNPNLWR